MKKLLRAIIITIGSVTILLVSVLLLSAVIFSPEYIFRVITNGESKITDYMVFPERLINKSTNPYTYTYALKDDFIKAQVNYESDGNIKTIPLDEVLKNNGTTSFIVIHDDKIICEEYFNGYNSNSVETSFSSVKSLVSMMIGMAIEDGYIDSVNQSITYYIPEFAGTEFEDITIENLLMMRSKIRYNEGFVWFTDDAKTYYYPDLRNLALNHMNIDNRYSGKFHYNNYHPLLLGIILERATGMNVTDYFHKKIWDKIGAEYSASWSLDSEQSGFEKMESGFNFKSIDYVKVGSMLLHDGEWNGYNVLNNEWVKLSTIAQNPLSSDDTDNDFFNEFNVGYKYMWYSIEDKRGGYDFYSAGKYGQYLYISKGNNTVILRTGMSEGSVDWWPDVLRQVAILSKY
ncbi:MAG: serine hydrolase domain-containing protein [Eubacteriales bacterium]